jgi:hypothetical protein
MPSRLVYLLVCLALLAPVSFAQGDAPQIAAQQAQRTAQQQAVLSGQQATEQVRGRHSNPVINSISK